MSLPPINERESDTETLHDVHSNGSGQVGNGVDSADDTDVEDKKELPEGDLEKYETHNNGLPETQLGHIASFRQRARSKLHLENVGVSSPWKGANPTTAKFRVRWKGDDGSSPDDSDANGESLAKKNTLGEEIAIRWSARYNRKGRNSFVVSRTGSTEFPPSRRHQTNRFFRSTKRILKNVLKMFITFPYWDMAFWSGWSYTWGSVLFVIDCGFAWVPEAFPWTVEPGGDYSVGILFFVGACLYQVGASIAYFEAINDGSFHGSAMKRFLEGHEDDQKRLLDAKIHAFFGHLKPGFGRISKKRKTVARAANKLDIEAGWDPDNKAEVSETFHRQRRGAVDHGVMADTDANTAEGETVEYLPWRWWPTWQNWKTHHVREIGWWACSIQLFGATLYGITGVVALPGILDSLEQWQENAAYWIPQIVASCCFLTASILFTLETQEKWWKPEPRALGWWIGFWAGVGSMGFLLCGALGPAYGSSGAQYQSGLSGLWGSCAYLISGFLQWYEAVNKNPIEELFNEPGDLKSFQIHL